jgi:phage baseplate assembly protein W
MGMTRNYLDKPMNVVESQISVDVVDLINTYEPRAKIKEVRLLDLGIDGVPEIKVVVEV